MALKGPFPPKPFTPIPGWAEREHWGWEGSWLSLLTREAHLRSPTLSHILPVTCWAIPQG